jgi:hypothetical protein
MKMVALGRVELPTFGLGNRCSIHLSYRAVLRATVILSLQQQQAARGCNSDELAPPLDLHSELADLQRSRRRSCQPGFSPDATRKPSLNHHGCVKPYLDIDN